MAKKAQIKRSWVVSPPNYVPGDGYMHYNFLKDAWNKACSLGEGSECWLSIATHRRDGSRSYAKGDTIFVVVRK